jgi:hypothetical protein
MGEESIVGSAQSCQYVVALLAYPSNVECAVWLFVSTLHLGQDVHLLPETW